MGDKYCEISFKNNIHKGVLVLTVFVNLKDAVFIFMAFRKHLILYTVYEEIGR